MNVFKWGGSSLPRHIALWEMFFSLPMFILFLKLIYSEGTLTFDWAVWMAFLWAMAGLVAAIIFWYAMVLPLQQRRDGGKR